MPAIEVDELNQDAVLWPKASYDDYGERTIASTTGTAIKVRWEQGRSESKDAQGNTIAFDSEIAVDREIAIGSILWLGKLADLPSPPTNLREVVDYLEIPDIKNRHKRRIVRVMKLSNELPST